MTDKEHPGRWPVHLDRDLVSGVVCDGCNTSADKWIASADYILELEAKNQSIEDHWYEMLRKEEHRADKLLAELDELEAKNKQLEHDLRGEQYLVVILKKLLGFDE